MVREQKVAYAITLILCIAFAIAGVSCTTQSGAAYQALIEERDLHFDEEISAPEHTVTITEVSLWNTTELQALDGSFPHWIEIQNTSSTDQQIQGWRIIVIDQDGSETRFAPFPELLLGPGAIRLLVFSPQAARLPVPAILFTTELPRTTAAIELLDEKGQVSDHFTIAYIDDTAWSGPPLRDISLVRDQELPEVIYQSSSPTPGLVNTVIVPEPEFLAESGAYSEVLLQFDTENLPEGYEIRYTINDGHGPLKDDSDTSKAWKYPTQHDGIRYEGPIELLSTSVVKSRVYTPSGSCSRQVIRTYLIKEETDLPVFSLVTDPADLWDPKIGIYSIGDDIQTPNFTKKDTRLVYTEFFEDASAQETSFSDTYLFRIYGSSSRSFLSKSFAIYAKRPASTQRIPNCFFDRSAGNIDDFYSIILRNSGGDFERTMLRDGLMTGIADDYDLEKQDMQPSVVFLNGQYWGILNIREKLNEYFLEDHTGVDPNAVDIIEGSYHSTLSVNEGTLDAVNRLFTLIRTVDAKYDASYALYTDMIDIDNLIDYVIFQTFINNTDWPWSNVKMWRPHTEDGKWRFILFDTDAGFDTTEYYTRYFTDPETDPKGLVSYDMIEYISSGINNDIISTLFYRLIHHRAFYEAFIRRYTELLDTVFKREVLLADIDTYSKKIEGEIPRHTARWSIYDPVRDIDFFLSSANWEKNLAILREFADKRTEYMRKYLAAFEERHIPPKPLRIVNGSFEDDDYTMWNLNWSQNRVDQQVIQEGDGHVGYLKITEGMKDPWDSVAFVYDDIFIQQGEKLRFSCDMRTGKRFSGDEFVRVILQQDNHEEVFSSDIVPSTKWHHEVITATYTGPDMFNSRLQFRVGNLRKGREVFIDNVKLEVME